MPHLARRWVGARGLARSAATHGGHAHRPAWPVATPRARKSAVAHL